MTPTELIILTISFLGGIGIFIFGMETMTAALSKLSSGRLERVLERMTSNIFMSVVFGALVTALIQSSGATTVMVVGFVNSGIMQLRQAVGIIMGANIGTTLTAQILRVTNLSGDSLVTRLMHPTVMGSLLIFAGIILYAMCKSAQRRTIGQLSLGLGLLFVGMDTMSSAVSPLADSPAFQEVFLMFENPVFGVLAGAMITALLQSSSASVGILQALTVTGVVKFSIAMPIIFGQNIGTCVVALISSIGATKNARRAAMIHLYFNMLGTLFFLALLYTVHALIDIPFWDDVMTYGSIANIHSVFNISCTVLFLPFSRFLVWLAEKTVRGDDRDAGRDIPVLDERFLSSPGVALDRAREVVSRMGEYALVNFQLSLTLLRNYDDKLYQQLLETEEAIDRMEDVVDNYLVRFRGRNLSPEENCKLSELLHSVGDFERVGDYVDNIADTARAMHEKGVSFSPRALAELRAISDACDEILHVTLDCYREMDYRKALRVEPLEQVIDDMNAILKTRHVDRLKNGTCAVEPGTMFLELLINLERISDHASNVAVYIINYYSPQQDVFDSHAYLRSIHTGENEQYRALFEQYTKKYITYALEAE